MTVPPQLASPPRTTAQRLALNSVCGVSTNIATALVSLFLTPFILRHMGDQSYGIWVVLGSVYAYSTVLQFGLYSAINRHIPMHLARGEQSEIRAVTSSTLAFFVALGLVVVVLTFVFADQLLGLFAIPSAVLPQARFALYTLGLVASVSLGLNSFASVLSGYQRYELMALSRFIALALRVCLVVALLGRGEPLPLMALIFGATECLVGALNVCLAWRLMPARPLQLRAIRWKVLQGMFGYGLNTFAYAVGAVVVVKTGEVISGIFLPPEYITYYALAVMPPMMVSGLVESFAGAIKPAVSDLDSRGDTRRIRELTLLSQKYVLLFVIPALAFFLVMGGDFYSVWLHRQMSPAVTLLYILAAGHLVRAAQFPMFLVLAGRGEHRFFGVMTIVMGMGAVLLGVLFCRILGWGSPGVALGSTVAMILVCGIALPCHFAKRLGMAVTDFTRRSWLPALCGVSPGIATLVLWKIGHPAKTLPELVLVGVSTALVLVPSIWFMALDGAERSRFSGMALASTQRILPGSLSQTLGRLRHLE